MADPKTPKRDVTHRTGLLSRHWEPMPVQRGFAGFVCAGRPPHFDPWLVATKISVAEEYLADLLNRAFAR